MKDRFGNNSKNRSRMEKKSSSIVTKTDSNGVEYEVCDPLYDIDGNYHKPRKKNTHMIQKKRKRK